MCHACTPLARLSTTGNPTGTPTGISRRALLATGAGVPLLAAGAAGAVGAPRAARRLQVGGRRAKVLVFTRTNGYRHDSIPDAIDAITTLGQRHGFGVVATEDPDRFTPRQLEQYGALVFANTVGNVLTRRSRVAIKQFVRSGGGWVGVHSAADTEYDWGFYSQLLSGGRFLAHPLQNQSGTLVRESERHLSTRHLDERWQIGQEEFYSFTNNVRGRARVLLSIDESSYSQDPNTSMIPGGLGPQPPYITPENLTVPTPVSGVMGDHPMSWTREIGRGLSWYTALGHEAALYTDPTYRRHLVGGLVTAIRHGQRNLT
ncbi:MAG: ThuA domain-containing protein [Nocardioides sp.]